MGESKQNANNQRASLARLTRIAIMAAVLCAVSPWAIPIGPIPISLATLAVYFIGIILGAKDGTVAVCVFLLLGAIGVPVFTGFEGGIQKLLGITGGYLFGYIPCALLTGLVSRRFPGKLAAVAGMAAGTTVLYTIGTAWFIAQTGRTAMESLSLCVFPFLPGDGAKIAVAAFAADPLKRRIGKLLSEKHVTSD